MIVNPYCSDVYLEHCTEKPFISTRQHQTRPTLPVHSTGVLQYQVRMGITGSSTCRCRMQSVWVLLYYRRIPFEHGILGEMIRLRFFGKNYYYHLVVLVVGIVAATRFSLLACRYGWGLSLNSSTSTRLSLSFLLQVLWATMSTKITQIDDKSSTIAWSPHKTHADVIALGTKVRLSRLSLVQPTN